MRKIPTALFALSLLLTLPACQSAQKAVRDVGYSAYELVGLEKRDLLKKRINEASEEQKEAGEEFKDALEKLRTLYGMQGGNLEKAYRKVNSAYEESEKQVREVQASRQKMETVANDLFAEWEKEIGQIQSNDYKSKSRAKLKETRDRFRELNRKLEASEKRMPPVLAKLKDQVLFLKHNLNAQSVASLKNEGARIEGDIETLLKDMNHSIREAEAFIKTME